MAIATRTHSQPGDSNEPTAPWRTIGAHDAPVPERHRRPLFPHERHGIVDDWAARIFHGHLFTTARVQSLIDVEIGRGLRRLARLDGFIALGYATRGDYVRETLGIGVRWAQQLTRLAGALERLPALDHALMSGALTTSKALALLPVVTPENVSAWCAFATASSVRALHIAVREGSCPEAERATGGGAADAAMTLAGSTDADVTDAAEAACTHEPAPEATGDEDGEEADDDDTDLVRLTLRVPAVVADLFDYTVDTVGRTAGGNIPRREAFACMLAELAATIALDEIDDADESPDTGPTRARVKRREQRARVEAMLERVTKSWKFLHDPPERVRLCADLETRRVPPDAFAIDTHLTRLTALRQRRHLDVGALLYNVCLLGLPRKLHFASLGHYARERLGFSGRSAQEIHRAYRRLHRFKKIRAAYEKGEITWSHVRLLLRIVHPGTEAAWIARARGVTFRRFELDVAAAHRLRDVDPMSWARDGTPPALSHEPPYSERSPVRPGHGLWAEAGARTCSHVRWRTIRLGVPSETFALWRRARATLLRRLEPVTLAGPSPVGASLHAAGPCEWQCLVELCRIVLETFERRTPTTLAERVVARDGECCTVPGCTRRAGHEAHHIVFRSRPGTSDALSNLTTVCATHHAHGLHAGRIRCDGTVNGGVRWELGVRTGHAPRRTYLGDVRMDG